MSMFRNLLTLKKQEDSKFWFIENGVINQRNTGGFTTIYIGGNGAHLSITEEDGYVRLYSGIWGANWLNTNNTIPFENYSKICFDYEYGSQSYGEFFLQKSNEDSGSSNSYANVISKNQTVARTVNKYALPNPIPETMDKFYSALGNITPEIKIYNMWLE